MKFHMGPYDNITNMKVNFDVEADMYNFFILVVIVISITLLRVIAIHYEAENLRAAYHHRAIHRPLRGMGFHQVDIALGPRGQ